MGRPRTVSDDEILDAAAAAIGRHGPARFTLAQVGAGAGLSSAGVVQRFGSKHGLLLALGRRSADDFERDVDAALGAGGDPLGALHRLLARQVDGIDTPEVLANHVAFLQLDLVDPELRAEARRHARAVQRGIARLLTAAVATGQLHTPDVAGLAQAVHTVFNGALITWALAGRGRLDRWLRTQVTVALAPYRPGWAGAARR